MSRSIIKKAAGIGSSTLVSRFFAYIREILMIRFLGVGAISDAFIIALRVPNSLRKALAEGGLSSVLVPALIRAERQDGVGGLNRLLTLSFIVIQPMIILLIVGMSYGAEYIVYWMSPGASTVQLAASAKFLKILAPFILFLSSSSVLASALQATHRFFLPSIAPALLNCIYIGFLLLSLCFSWTVETFCWTMILASIFNFLIHVFVCLAHNFTFSFPDKQAWQEFKVVGLQLLPCLLTVVIGEINFWIDSGFASFLPSGTISLLKYAYQFVNIPLGVIATSLSMVLLPHFAKIGDSKKELGLYLAEAIKFVTWMMLPITIVMIYCSREIFETMFLSPSFTADHVSQAQWNMNAYLLGLTFFALEKILMNAFYALRAAGVATGVAIVTIGMNYCMNSFFMALYGGMGLALATSISAAARIVMFVVILAYQFKIDFKMRELFILLRNYVAQLAIFASLFVFSAIKISGLIANLSCNWVMNFGLFSLLIDSNFFLHSFGYWLWFGPLVALFFIAIYVTRNIFGVSFSYLNE